jgi:hypothetical protein
MKNEVIRRCIVGNGGVEEPANFRVDPAEKLPNSLKIRMQHAVGRPIWKSSQVPTEFIGPEH